MKAKKLAVIIASLAFVAASGNSFAAQPSQHKHSRGAYGTTLAANDKGNVNRNSQTSPDASRGLDRARDRMSEQGLEHEKAKTGGRLEQGEDGLEKKSKKKEKKVKKEKKAKKEKTRTKDKSGKKN